MVGRLPTRELEDVMTRSRLRLGRNGQQVLVALRGDVVDRDLDLVLRPPFLAKRLRRVVGAGHPVVPEAHRQPAAGLRMADMGHRNDGGRGSGRRQKTTTGQSALEHDVILRLGSRSDVAGLFYSRQRLLTAPRRCIRVWTEA